MNQRGSKLLRRLLTCVPALVLMVLCAHVGAQTSNSVALLVRLKDGASIKNVSNDYSLIVLDKIDSRHVYEVISGSGEPLQALVAQLDADPRIVYCEVEGGIQLPEVVAGPFHLAFDVSASAAAFVSQPAYNQINMNSAPPPPSAQTVTVAVLDTGADLTHPDLAGRLVPGFNAVAPGTDPTDVLDGTTNSAAGHGTMVTGIIVRTSPESMIMPIRVLNADGTGSLMNVIHGIHYAVQHGAQVINMSFGTTANSVAFKDAVDEANDAGVVLVAAGGNLSSNAPNYPAAYRNVIGVASVDGNDVLSTFSDFGADAAVVAPGESIRSTYPGGLYATWSGTSFAAPFVTAEAAEIIARHAFWAPRHVARRILHTADSVDSLNPSFDGMLGAGIIDFTSALND
jgi:subtilisin family serine protease